MLREYQRRVIDGLYKWFEDGNEGHPCLVLPTGAGKSHIVAALCKEAIQNWPETRILMLTHVKELIEQNAEKMLLHWPNAPLGIYSASVGRKELGEPITFGGIQSLRTKADDIGHIDLVIIDECHLVNHKAEGGYRMLIDALAVANPSLRVIGLTATPYRLGHGFITDKPAIFDALLDEVSIEELVFKGFLAPLRSKRTDAKLDVSGVKKRGGEYIESELQAAVDTSDNNERVVNEVIRLAGDRKAWLFFCTGVDHAEHIAEVLRGKGIPAECVTGETSKKERERIIADFKAGKLRALTNANVLTTGFDYPDIDLIAMLRPTMSPGLYVQMAGRGMRIKSHTDHCMVLDFAGVVSMHGPITAIRTPSRKSGGDGEAPVKVCDNCGELCHTAVRECPACGSLFPEPEPKPKEMTLRNDDIMRLNREPMPMEVERWTWREHTSRSSGKLMLACTYYSKTMTDPMITEYFPVLHPGFAGQRAMQTLYEMASRSNAKLAQAIEASTEDPPLAKIAAAMNTKAMPPSTIKYTMDGKFFRVTARYWE